MSKEEGLSKRYTVIDNATGEVVNVDVFIGRVSLGYWEKAYAKTLAEYIDVTGTNSNKVLAYLVKYKTSDNLVNGTVRGIAEDSGTSPVTVAKVFKVLQNKGLLKRIRNGCYMLSPDIMRHGSNTKGALLLRMWDKV